MTCDLYASIVLNCCGLAYPVLFVSQATTAASCTLSHADSRSCRQTVGSMFWCINATLFFCYFTSTSLVYATTESATAFLGGTCFIVGSYLGWIECLNPAQDANFGWELDEATKYALSAGVDASGIGLRALHSSCRSLIEPKHHRRSLGRSRHHFGRHHSASAAGAYTLPDWRWFGTYPSLAYVANTVQLFGATVFWVSTLCGLPGVLPSSGTAGGLEQAGQPEALWVGLYWSLQILGAPCFVVAGACFCIEVQDRWWTPKPFSIGWQV